MGILKKVSVALIIAMTVSSVTFASDYDLDSMTMADIKEAFATLESENQKLSEENESLKQGNSSNETASDDEEVKQLQDKVESLKADKKELNAKVKALEEELEALKSQETEVETEPSTEIVGLQYTDVAVVRMVQEALNAAGFDCGTPDGQAGSKTRSALEAYQRDKGINVNGVITDELLEAMGIADKIEEAAKLEASKAEYSTDFSYESLMRNPEQHKGKKYKISGKVLQAYANSDPDKYLSQLFFYKDGSYDQLINVTYDEKRMGTRILEDDYITVWGTMEDLYTYNTISRKENTIPSIAADIVELN